jgi:hypothetical protein
VKQQAERAEQTISWLEEHSDEIGSPAAVRVCIQRAVRIRERQHHVADLFREVEEVLADAEPVTFDLKPSRKRR